MLASRLASCAATRPRWRDPAGHLLSSYLRPAACPTRPPWRAGRPARWRPPCRGGRRPGLPWQFAEHQRRGQRGPAELRHRNHGQHTHHQQHGQRRELHHGGRRVHGHADGLGRSNRGKLRSHRCAHGRHADHHRGGLHGPAGLREPGLHLHGHERRSVDGQRGLRRRDELGHGLRAAALRLQHAHRDQHLRLLGRSLPDEELGGLEQAASVQQQRGCWATRARGSSWSETAGRTSASSS